MKICLITPIKQEELYVKEWLDYYKNIGIDKIIFADNNDFVYPFQIKPIIETYINNGFVELLDYKGKKGIQIEFYNDVYFKYQNDFDWFGFIDIDEFIELPKHKNIHDFLTKINHDSVALRWYNHGDNENLFYENKPVRERFEKMSENQSKGFQPTKYFLKSKLKEKIKYPFCPPTTDVCDVLNDLNFETISRPKDKFCFMKHNPKYLETTYISHYITKSTEEYIKYKMLRGRVANSKAIRYSEQFYFSFNKFSKEKHDLFENYFMGR